MGRKEEPPPPIVVLLVVPLKPPAHRWPTATLHQELGCGCANVGRAPPAAAAEAP